MAREDATSFLRMAQAARSAGSNALQLSPEQTAKWRKNFEPVLQEWTRSRANGEETMTKYRELYQQAGS